MITLTQPKSPQSKASQRIEAFREQFGEGHLYLACHAALPLALTPDLLYSLWANFQQDNNGIALEIPWVAVADLLLSNLCEHVGYDLYEMEDSIRDELMHQLKTNQRFGEVRIRELSEFVKNYIAHQLDSPDLDVRDFAQAQQWRADAYLNPAIAAHEIAGALACLSLDEHTEWIRMAGMLETLKEPLEAYPSLLKYTSAMADFVRGNKDTAAAKFQDIVGEENQLEVAGVKLSIPIKLAPPQPTKFKPDWTPLLAFLRQTSHWLVTGGAVAFIGGLTFSVYVFQEQNNRSSISTLPTLFVPTLPNFESPKPSSRVNSIPQSNSSDSKSPISNPRSLPPTNPGLILQPPKTSKDSVSSHLAGQSQPNKNQSSPAEAKNAPLQITPSSLDFGNQSIGTRSETQTINITNRSFKPVQIREFYFSNGTEFEFSGICNNRIINRSLAASVPNYGFIEDCETLDPGASAVLTIVFAPKFVRKNYFYTDYIRLTDNLESKYWVTLKGVVQDFQVGVNIHSGPGLNFPVIGGVEEGGTVYLRTDVESPYPVSANGVDWAILVTGGWIQVNRGEYIVYITEFDRNRIEELLNRARRYVPSAFLDSTSGDSIINLGRFDSYAGANSLLKLLKQNKFNVSLGYLISSGSSTSDGNLAKTRKGRRKTRSCSRGIFGNYTEQPKLDASYDSGWTCCFDLNNDGVLECPIPLSKN